jgi:hypothetical protein
MASITKELKTTDFNDPFNLSEFVNEFNKKNTGLCLETNSSYNAMTGFTLFCFIFAISLLIASIVLEYRWNFKYKINRKVLQSM